MSKLPILRGFIILLTLTLYIGCGKNNTNNVNIEIQVPLGEYDSLGYYLSQENLTAYSLWGFKREYFDSTGSISFDIETNEIGWFFITFFSNRYKDNKTKNKSRVFMLIRPGESYRIEYDSSNPSLFKIEGDFGKAQNLYNEFNHSHGSHQGNWRTNSDSLPEVFLAHLEDSINNSIKPFLDLFERGDIDSAYYNTVYNQMKYSHANALIGHLAYRQRVYNKPKLRKYHKEIHPLNISQDDRQRIEEAVFIKYPVIKNEAGILPGFGDYIDKYLMYKTRSDSILISNTGSYKERLDLVNMASSYLEEDLVEFYFAHQFGSASSKSGPDSLATYLFIEFKERYPESHFMPGVILNIEGLTGYYAAFYPGLKDSRSTEVTGANKTIFSPDIKFIQGKDSIASFDSLVNQFRGKNLYVDFWASWCPPCRYEFRFADSLHHFLQAHNIEMLYISTDEDESKWLNVLSNYNLKGYHYRVSNPELRKELRKIVDFLPTFMIIDSTGKIVEYNAENPHTKSKLYDQLIESLN